MQILRYHYTFRLLFERYPLHSLKNNLKLVSHSLQGGIFLYTINGFPIWNAQYIWSNKLDLLSQVVKTGWKMANGQLLFQAQLPAYFEEQIYVPQPHISEMTSSSKLITFLSMVSLPTPGIPTAMVSSDLGHSAKLSIQVHCQPQKPP